MVEDYGTRLATAMHVRGVSAQQLAVHLGVSYQAIRKVLRGQSTALTAVNNSYAARFLKISSDWLATGDGFMDETTSAKGMFSYDKELSISWHSASAEAREVAQFALSNPNAPLPPWADKDMRVYVNSMLYAALNWTRGEYEHKQEPKKIAT